MIGLVTQRFGRRGPLALSLCLLCVVSPRPALSQPDQQQPAAPAAPQLIVRFHSGASELSKRNARTASGAVFSRSLPLIDAEVWTVQGDPHVEAARLANEPGVLYAEPDYLLTADRIPNDPQFPLQYGLHNTGQTQGAADADVDAPEAWDQSSGRPILLGIIDTGIDSAHPDLLANLWVNPGEIAGNGTDDDANGYIDDMHGWDFVEWDNQPFDLHGHGTHVAGIAAAVGNNGLGVAGVHWSARLVALRFLNAAGVGSTSSAVLAIEYAARMHIPVTCNSWGGAPFSQAMRDAIAAASDSGMLFVAAVGNSGKNTDVTPHYPASYDFDAILAVAATDHMDRLAFELNWRSNFGHRSVDLAAPGVEVLSTWPGADYRKLSGTSMAAPHVAGAAALVWSEHPQLSASHVKARLLATVDPLPDLSETTVSGGRLNLMSALAEPDSLSPGAVSDLHAVRVEGTRVLLGFSASGDDAQAGTAGRYIVRYSSQPLASAPSGEVVEWISPVAPLPPGSAEQMQVTGFEYGSTYYFEIRTEDDWFNRSPASNEIVETTLGPPTFDRSDTLVQVTVAAGSDTALPMYLFNRGEGELFFSSSVEYPHDLFFAAATAPVDTLDLLLVYADNGGFGLKAQLNAFADVGRVELWYAGLGSGEIPAFRDVRDFDVVVAWNNRPWADPFEIGGLLAECVDSGLAVVTFVDCWGTGPFASLGRYFEEPGYCPFASTGEALFEVRTLGDFVPAHPIMKGVQDLAIASYHNQVRLSDGARPVAFWNDGTPLVATTPGSVAINVWPGDGYHWLGDFPQLAHNAIRYAAGLDSWLDAAPALGEVAPGDSLALFLHVDGRRLLGGEHTGFVRLSTSDPLAPAVQQTVTLTVIGQAQLVGADSVLEWHDTFMGYLDTTYLPLRNDGTAPLTAHSFVFDVGHFHTIVDTLHMPAGGVGSLPVVFDPPSVGEIWCNLDFVTNDPLRALVRAVLHVQTELPPSVSLLDLSSSAALIAGATAVDTLRLLNSGEGALHFHTVIRGSGTLSGAAAAGQFLDVAADSVTALVWTRYADLSPGNEFEHFTDALEVYATPVSLQLTATADPGELEALLFDRSMFIVLEQENALPDLLSIAASFAPVLQEFVTRGGTVLFLSEWGGASGLASATGLMDVSPVGRGSQIPLRKAAPDHPLLSGTTDSLVGGNLTVWYEVTSPSTQVVLSDTSGQYAVVAAAELGAGRSILFGFDFFAYNQGMARLLHNAVLLSRQTFAWLDVAPDSGQVAAGEQVDLLVNYDAADRDGGVYRAEIVLETNDPAGNRHSVPVQLAVTDGPHLAPLSPVDFGTVYAGFEAERVLTVRNSGNRELRVDSLGPPPAGYDWDGAAFVVPARSVYELSIRFHSTVTGHYDSWLRLFTNDPTSAADSVALHTLVLNAPHLIMSADTLEAQLLEGGRATVAWTLRNDGGSLLDVTLTPRYEGMHVEPEPALVALSALPSPVSQAGVAATDDGRVFVFGGLSASRSVLKSLYMLDPATGQWQARAPMPIGDYGMATAVDQRGRVYSFASSQAISFRYDSDADAWEVIAAMPEDRVWGASATLGQDGLIYVTGGQGNGPDDALTFVQVYHPDGDFWTVAPPLNLRRYGHATVAAPDGRIYVMGGRTSYDEPPTPTLEVFDPATRAWSLRANRPLAGTQFAACLGKDQRIYTLGGKINYEDGMGPFSDEIWIYDPIRDTWSTGPRLPRGLGECGAALAGDFIHLLGGHDSTAVASHWGLRTPAWLGWDSSVVSMAAGESLSVALQMDAWGMAPGLHSGLAYLTSNDPGSPVLTKLVELTVTASPKLWLIDTAVTFGEVVTGVQDSVAVYVANVGTAALELAAVSNAPSEFPPPLPVSIPGLSSGPLWLRCTPTSAGPLEGRLEVHTNDPERPVASLELSAVGVHPGLLSVDTTAIVWTLPPLAETTVTLSLRNDGAGPLHWSVTGADLPVVDPGEPSLSSRPGREALAADATHKRRLSGIVVAVTDARFVPGYTMVLEDLQARGAKLTEYSRSMSVASLDSIDVLILDDYIGSLFLEDQVRVRDWVYRGGRLLLQNRSPIGLEEATVILAGSGLKLYAQTLARRTHSHFEGRAALWGADSIAAPSSALWCEASDPAEVLVRDNHGRAIVAASRWGRGRVAVTCSELLDDAYVIRADNRVFAGRLLDWLAVGTPLVVETASGTIDPGSVEELMLSTISRPLSQGIYHEVVTLNSDDPARSSVDVQVSLAVPGQAHMHLASDTLRFDTVFVGYSGLAYLELANLGTAPLEISPMGTHPEEFSLIDSAVTVSLLGSARLPIRFAPVTHGAIEGKLILHTNDPSAPSRSVVLVAYGLRPPVLISQSAPLDITLQAGDTGTAVLSLTNEGESNLAMFVRLWPDTTSGGPRRTMLWRPEGAARPPDSAFGQGGAKRPGARGVSAAAFIHHGRFVSFGITERGDLYPFEYPATKEQLWGEGITVVYRAEGVDYVKGSYVFEEWIVGDSLVTEQMDSQLVAVRYFGHTDDGRIGVERNFFFENQRKYVAIDTRLVNQSGDPLEDVVLKDYADWDLEGSPQDDNWDYDTLRQMPYGWDQYYAGMAALEPPDLIDLEGRLDNTARPTLVNFPSGPVHMYDGLPLLHFELGDLAHGGSAEIHTAFAMGDSLSELQREIDRGLQRVKWLATDLWSTVIEPGASLDLALSFDATRLFAGDYRARLMLASNDPARPEVEWPVQLRVVGAPVVDTDRDSLDFGVAYMGYPSTLELKVSNQGTDSLRIVDVTGDLAEVTPSWTSVLLQPHRDTVLHLTFLPRDSGHVTGRLVLIHSDSLRDPIDLPVSAQVEWPPELSVAADTLALTLGVGTVAHRSFTVHNSGRGLLHWSFAPHAQITAFPPSGTLPSGSSALLTFRVSAAGLAPGHFLSAVELVHNDPALEPVAVPFVLDVFAVQRGDTYTDNRLDLRDIVFMVNSIWKGGPDPVGDSGDLDCDRAVTVADLTLLINLILKASPPPPCDD